MSFKFVRVQVLVLLFMQTLKICKWTLTNNSIECKRFCFAFISRNILLAFLQNFCSVKSIFTRHHQAYWRVLSCSNHREASISVMSHKPLEYSSWLVFLSHVYSLVFATYVDSSVMKEIVCALALNK